MAQSKKPEPPIQNLEAIDVIGKRRDGGLDLVIVVSSKLLDSQEHKKLFGDRLDTYLATIKLKEFQAEFGHPKPIRIVVKPSVEPDPAMASWLRLAIAPRVAAEFGVELVLDEAKK